MSLRRISLLSGFAALAMLATAGGISSASAADVRHPRLETFQLNKAPTNQTSKSFLMM